MKYAVLSLLLVGCGGSALPFAANADGSIAPDGADSQSLNCRVDLDNPIEAQTDATCSTNAIDDAIGLRAVFNIDGRAVDLEIDSPVNHLSTLPFPGRTAVLSVSGGIYCAEWSGSIREDTDPSNAVHVELSLNCSDNLQPSIALNGTIDFP